MKIVIQNPKDLSYLDPHGRWISDCRQALTFENFRVAVDFFSAHKLGDVQIVLRPDDDWVEAFPSEPHSLTSSSEHGMFPMAAMACAACSPRPTAVG
jgi:hypothetical protein